MLMTAVLLLLMAYSLVGEAAHEWLGVGMGVLFIIHHILNNAWSRTVFKGRYTPYRVLQTTLVALVALAMLGSMGSGIVLSRYALGFLSITSGQALARTVHLLCAYWGFVFMSLHLGLHWSMMMTMAGRMFKKPSATRTYTARIAAFLIAGYGIWAFIKRDIGQYMFLKTQFVFFDFDEPLIYFLLDYIAVMGLGVFLGHYLAKAVRKHKQTE